MSESTQQSQVALDGVRIALLFQNRLKYSTRFEREVRLLRSAGARVSLVSVDDNQDVSDWFDGVVRCSSFEFGSRLPASELSWRPARITDNLLRNLVRPVLSFLPIITGDTPLRAKLLEHPDSFDLYWAVDVMPLASAVLAARTTGAAVVYETIDLVPEYRAESRPINVARKISERRFVPRAGAFITAGSEYANYYRDQYPDALGFDSPIVVENFVDVPPGEESPVHAPRRFLFFGNLAPDRPLDLIIRAFARAERSATLTIQGRDLVAGRIAEMVDALGLEGRVFLVDPCDPADGPTVARGFDVGIVALSGCDENELRAPTAKVGTYLAGGLFLLASDLPGIRAAAGEGRFALYVSPQSEEAWESAFRRVASMSDDELAGRKHSALLVAKSWNVHAQCDLFVGAFRAALDRGCD